MATVVSPVPETVPPPASSRRGEELVKVYVWEWPIRLVHWGLVLSLAVLSVTGFYLHAPYLEAHSERAWVMGTLRFVHEVFGFVLIGVVLLRIYWFFAGNRWAHWRSYVPLTKVQFTEARSMISYYTFRRRGPVPQVGHNPLAAFSYLTIYGLFGIECITGLVLFGDVSGNKAIAFTLGWIPRIIDIQYLRTAHFIIMFLLTAFFIHHIYSAILVSLEEKNGLMESIFSGWKFVSRKLLAHDETIKGHHRTGKLKK